MVVVLFLVMAGIAVGPLLARVRKPSIRRLTGWAFLIVLIAVTDLVGGHATPVVRMIALCCVLLAAMKGLVYAEWAAPGKALPLGRYAVFAFLWFGMNPGSFATRRVGLTWRADMAVGLLLAGIGTLGAWCVAVAGWRQVAVMFVPLSLAFHFGALRVLKAGHRAAGFPVRTLFPNLLRARGIGDFWSSRWNVGYSQMMQRLVGRPLGARFGPTAGVFAVFLVSGLLHEIAITLPVRSGFGLPSLYFILHGVLTVAEGKLGKPIGKVPALVAVIAPMGLLFPEAFQREVIAWCLGLLAQTSDRIS